ncbi:MAG: hypothetical protein ACXQTW_02030 [Candidatus Methanospirareceae archaeon]
MIKKKMETKKKAIAGVLVVAIALAGVAIAVSAEGEGGVQPMGLLPGSVTNTYLGNDISADKITTGVFPVARGGTGLDSIAAGGILYASADNMLSRIAPTAANQVLRSTDANALQFGSLVADDIPDLDAGKITTGTLDIARIPSITAAKLADTAIPSITVTNTSDDISTSWFDVLNTSADKLNKVISNPGRTTKFIIIYSANVTGWTGGDTGDKVRIKCNVTATDKSVSYSASPGEITIADWTTADIIHTATFFKDSVPSGKDYYINVSAKSTAGTFDLYNQTLTVIAVPAA